MNKRELSSRQTQLEMAQIHQGPIPSAAEMQRYQEVYQALPEQIVQMARNEQQHRIELDNRMLTANTWITFAGMFCSVVCVLLIMGSAAICAISGHPIPAGFIGTGGVGMLVIMFIGYSKISKPDSKK